MKTSIDNKIMQELIASHDPSIQYFALIKLLDKSPAAKVCREAQQKVMQSDVVKAIFKHQDAEGFWGKANNHYAKYNGTVWQLLILTELGVDPDDKRIKKACEFVLQNVFYPERGGFSIKASQTGKGGLASGVIPCLTGNMVWSLLRLGYLQDQRVQTSIDWITKYQRFDDGIAKPAKGWPYDNWEMCYGKHTCLMGVVKNLKALAEIPVKKRTIAVKQYIERACEFLLLHHVYKSSKNPNKILKPSWLKFHFPLMYQTDVLEIVELLLMLGCNDNRMQAALDLIMSKRLVNGCWKLDENFNDKFYAPIEKVGQASQWITLKALHCLKLAGLFE